MGRLYFLIFSTAFLTTFPPSTVWAKPIQLPQVEVRASSLPQEKTLPSTETITYQDLDLSQQKTIVDALEETVGIHVTQSGGPGSQTSVCIRGASSHHTLLVIDGMKATDPGTMNGLSSFEHFLTDGLEHIQIQRNPLDSKYSGHIGVVQMKTAKGDGDPKSTLRLYGGSFQTFCPSAQIQGKQGNVDLNINVSRLNTQGIVTKPQRLRKLPLHHRPSPYQNTSLSSRLGYQSSQAYTSIFNRLIVTEKNYIGSDDFPDMKQNSQQHFHRIQSDFGSENVCWRPSIALSYSDQISRYKNLAGASKPQLKTHGKSLQAEALNTWCTLKTQPLSHWVDFNLFAEKKWWATRDFSKTQKATRTEQAIALQNRLLIDNAATLAVNARLDYVNHQPTLTYRLGTHLPFNPVTLHASYGTGLKIPTLFQQFGKIDTFTGNPNLKAEKNEGFDVGFTHKVDRIKWGSTYFHSQIKNLIHSNSEGTTLINLNRVHTQGLENFIRFKPSKKATFKLSHTYLHAFDRQSKQRLLRRSRHKVVFHANYFLTESIHLGGSARFIGRRQDINSETFKRQKNKSFLTVDLTGTYRVTDKLKLQGRINNVFNRRYEPILGYQAPGLGVYGGVYVQV